MKLGQSFFKLILVALFTSVLISCGGDDTSVADPNSNDGVGTSNDDSSNDDSSVDTG